MKFKQLLTLILIISGISGSVHAQNLPGYVPKNGLVGWWPFNGNANDESGNGNNGMVNGAVFDVDRNNLQNASCNLYGNNDYVEILTTNNQFSSLQYTISFWMKSNQSPSSTAGGPNVNPSIISRLITGGPQVNNPYNNSHVDNYCMYEIGGGIIFNTSTNGGGVVNSILGNTWKHIVFSVQTDSSKAYVNGVKVGSYGNTYLNNFTNYPIRFGRSKHTYWKDYSGILDDIGIWNRALTAEEIETLYKGCSIPPVSISASGKTTICAGESVQLSGSFGAGYTYEWSNNGTVIPGANGINYTATQSGNYTLKVSSGGCNVISSGLGVTVNPSPNVSLSGINNPCINGQPVSLNGSPSGGTYSGNGVSGTSFSPIMAGKGTHTITYSYTDNNGCKGTAIQSTTVNGLPQVSISGLNGSYASSDPPVTLTGTPSGGIFTGDGVSGNMFYPAYGGTSPSITYIYTDANGCTNAVCAGTSITGLQPDKSKSAISSARLYPNPSDGNFMLEITRETPDKADLIIINAAGQLISNHQIVLTGGTNRIPVSLEGKASGTYFIHVQSPSGKWVGRMMKD